MHRMISRLLVIVSLVAFFGSQRGILSRADTPVPLKKIAGFTLKDAAGQAVSLSDFRDKKAVVVLFLGTECPINNAYQPKLADMAKSYAEKGVQFLAINANQQDTAERVADHAKKFAIAFPVLKDEGNIVADQFAAQRTPEAFVLDAQGQVKYRGRIDDQFGYAFQRPAPTRRDLIEAIDELLAGKAVTTPTTPVAGCMIARVVKPKAEGTVTFAKDVSRILQKNCQECHRPGQIGPMSLLSYDDASAWSETIREVVQEKRMPPWHADPKHSKFQNDRSLPAADKATLLSWIDQGCPKGDMKDLPPAKEYSQDWRIGKPDVVFTMPKPYTVPAKAGKAGIPYQFMLIETKFEEDRWVQAVEAKPGNLAVVHHILVYFGKPGARERTPDGIGKDLLVAYAPGDMPSVFTPGTAKRIPKGSFLALQMHYTPNGTEQTDQSSVGLIFAKEPPKHEIKVRAIATRGFSLPPGDSNHAVASSSTFPKETLVFNLFPHMHLRGKDFQYEAIYPDGKREVVLSVPRYDFGWQSNYILKEPLRLPAGSRIECTAHFDNSKNNPNNPDPTKTVRWGDQTWDEMMIGFLDYAVVEKAVEK